MNWEYFKYHVSKVLSLLPTARINICCSFLLVLLEQTLRSLLNDLSMRQSKNCDWVWDNAFALEGRLCDTPFYQEGNLGVLRVYLLSMCCAN